MKITGCLPYLTFIVLASIPVQAIGGKPLRLTGELIPDGSVAGFPRVFGGLDIYGDLAVAGAQGSAIVFDISNRYAPREIARLTPSDDENYGDFGASVAVWGNRVYVGDCSANSYTGAVYLYDFSDRLNVTEQKLTAFDASEGAFFGYDIAVSGDRLIVGSPALSVYSPPSAAYVLDVSAPDNIRQTKLFPTAGSGGTRNFAQQVDISGDLAVLGDVSDSTVVPFGGAAHVYDLSDFDHPRQQLVRSTIPRSNEGFGDPVAVDGTTVLVGVSSDPGDENPPGASEGAVWAFDFSDWDNPTQHEFGRLPLEEWFYPPFGVGLDLANGIALLGAFNEDDSRGAAYLFDVHDTDAPLKLDRIASPVSSATRFGRSLAFDGTSAIISTDDRVFLYSTVPEPTAALLAGLAVGLWGAIHRGRRP